MTLQQPAVLPKSYGTTTRLPSEDALEFAKIVESEDPDRENKAFGQKAKAWLGDKISTGGEAAWKVGLSAGTELLKKAALKYYGLDT